MQMLCIKRAEFTFFLGSLVIVDNMLQICVKINFMLQSVVEEGYCCRFLACYSVI